VPAEETFPTKSGTELEHTTVNLMAQDPEDDGLLIRSAKPWVRDKLGILERYLDQYSWICSRRTPAWYYVDAFAGPGINQIETIGVLMWGSPLLALRVQPPISRCLLIDSNRRAVSALTKRVEPFGDRAIVERGDCNVDLLRLMEAQVNRRGPCLCLLDPEGMEVDWVTIEALANFRRGRFRTELLILFDDDGVGRVMPTWTIDPANESRIRRFWRNDRWRAVLERRQKMELTWSQVRFAYLEIYVQDLHALGYEHVLTRQIRSRGREGAIQYHLVFATDNKAGLDRMDWCFKNVVYGEQVPIPGLEQPLTSG
jgi:three-Cys-motif partner protein